MNTFFNTILCILITGVTFAANSLKVESTSTEPSCRNTSNGRISLHISGGKAPYTVTWSDGKTGSERSDLAAGNYTWNVLDSKGNQTIGSVRLHGASPISVTFGSAVLTSVNGTLAAADFKVSGGTPMGDPGYIVKLNGQLVHENISPIEPTKMTMELTDAAGCSLHFPVLVVIEYKQDHDVSSIDPTLKFNGLPVVNVQIPKLKLRESGETAVFGVSH
jgi:hypothetical protein